MSMSPVPQGTASQKSSIPGREGNEMRKHLTYNDKEVIEEEF